MQNQNPTRSLERASSKSAKRTPAQTCIKGVVNTEKLVENFNVKLPRENQILVFFSQKKKF
jgi:hypothetical protein